MGNTEALLTLSQGRVPGVVAYIGTVPAVNLAAAYANAAFTASIKTAYGIASDGSDYAAKTAGHDPALLDPRLFKRVPMWALVATDDTALKWTPFAARVAAYQGEVITVPTTGGHSTSQIAAHAADMRAFAAAYI